METNEKDLTALSVELPEVTQEAVEDRIGLDAYLDKENETAEEAREAADKKIRQIARPRHLAGEKGRRFKGYTLEDCDCRYCLYYGGKRRRRVLCLADVCVCKSEIEEARRRERKRR